MLRIGRNPFELFRNATRKYGDICYISGGKARLYLVNNPDYIHEILVTNHKNFAKNSPLRFLGNGLITSNGDYHHRQKRLIQPAFHHDRIASYGKIMTDYTERISSAWKDGQVLDMQEEMTRLTLEIVAKCLFGADVDYAWKEVRVAADLIIDYFDKLTGPLGPIVRRLPTNKKYLEAVDKLDQVVYKIIKDRRMIPSGEFSDLLSMLLKARDEEGGMMSDVQVRDETLTLLFAGHETTSNALTWTWYLLCKNPNVEQKLHDELDRLLPRGKAPTAEDMPKLSFTTKVFTESLRLYPSVRLIPRVAINDCEIDGYRMPKGSLVLMSQYLIHHDPRFYKDPEEFNPDRWTEEMETKLPEYAYFPFGGGPRRCVGEPFAWMEAALIIATIARAWRMLLVPGQNYELRPRVGSRPKNGMILKLSTR